MKGVQHAAPLLHQHLRAGSKPGIECVEVVDHNHGQVHIAVGGVQKVVAADPRPIPGEDDHGQVVCNPSALT